MQISKSIYKVSGVEYETNSNIYAIKYDEGIVLIDSGYQEEQWERVEEAMKWWKMDMTDVTHIFITHSHFDHAGNVCRFNKQGAKVLASAIDKDKIEHGNPEMEKLFGSKWICGKVDEVIVDGQIFEFPGGLKIQALKTPGHCKGTMSYLIETDELRAIAMSDMFFVTPCPPKDRVGVELGYMGSEDFDLDEYIDSLDRISKIDADILLPGHYYTYRGKKVKEICREAYDKAIILRHENEN